MDAPLFARVWGENENGARTYIRRLVRIQTNICEEPFRSSYPEPNLSVPVLVAAVLVAGSLVAALAERFLLLI